MSDKTGNVEPSVDWSMVRQALSALRQPELWFDHIRETVRLENDELLRTVQMRIVRDTPVVNSDSKYLLTIQTPRKGTLVDLQLDDDTAKRGEVLSHDEHARLTRLMIAFQFRSYMTHAIKLSKNPRSMLARSLSTLEKLVGLVDRAAESTSELASISDLFEDGYLRGYPRGRRNSETQAEMRALYSLCQLAIDRYLRLVRFSGVDGSQATVGYTYSQEREARTYGPKVIGLLRRWFRAPASMLFVHAPLARLTSHYELRLESVPGYYVHEQFALHSGEHPSQETTRSTDSLSQFASHEPWWSTRRGGWATGYIFVGNGYRSSVRLYGAFRLLELPPGATGRAFAGTALGFLTLSLVIIWSLLHKGEQSSIAPSIIISLVAFGSAALDNTTAKRDLFNSPLAPRLVLFCQTNLAILTSVWLLARGTAHTSLEPTPGIIEDVAVFITDHEWLVGVSIIASSATLLILISRNAYRAAQAYDTVMRDALDK